MSVLSRTAREEEARAEAQRQAWLRELEEADGAARARHEDEQAWLRGEREREQAQANARVAKWQAAHDALATKHDQALRELSEAESNLASTIEALDADAGGMALARRNWAQLAVDQLTRRLNEHDKEPR